MTEDQLQESTERGENISSYDGKAYRTVFNALNREHDFVLPPSFANKIVGRLAEQRSSRDMLWLYLGLGSMLITLAIVIAIIGSRTDFRFLTMGTFTFLSSYKGLVIFGIAFILTLQWIDKKFVRKAV